LVEDVGEFELELLLVVPDSISCQFLIRGTLDLTGALLRDRVDQSNRGINDRRSLTPNEDSSAAYEEEEEDKAYLGAVGLDNALTLARRRWMEASEGRASSEKASRRARTLWLGASNWAKSARWMLRWTFTSSSGDPIN